MTCPPQAQRRPSDALGCLRPDVEPQVTTHIREIVALIERLLQRNMAYVTPGVSGGDVWFDVARFPAYGQLSGQLLDQLEARARVEPAAFR